MDWTAVELAQAAGVTPRCIRNRCASGKFEGAYKRANAWFIPLDVGQQWVEESKKAASTSEEEETAS